MYICSAAAAASATLGRAAVVAFRYARTGRAQRYRPFFRATTRCYCTAPAAAYFPAMLQRPADVCVCVCACGPAQQCRRFRNMQRAACVPAARRSGDNGNIMSRCSAS